MGAVQLTDSIYWVGAIDWTGRSFHGFEMPRGTTYNSYLIVDDTVTLVDAVKAPFVHELLRNVSQVVDPASIGLVVANHVEMDHSSGLPAVLSVAKDARLVASPKGVEGLEKHYQRGWAMDAMETGSEISIGQRTLEFVDAPMVHWPDSMFTWVKEDRVLLPNDAFGQHYASGARFDDEVWDDPDLMLMARDYFANIVWPYAPQVQKALGSAKELGIEPEIIGPSHGIVWRRHVSDIVHSYASWCRADSEPRVVIAFDTMWGSTELMAKAIAEGVTEAGVPLSMFRIGHDPVGRIIGEIMVARAVLIGGPTLNAGVFPSVAGFLTYLKGLRPKKKLWGAFGSYGWAPVGQKGMRDVLDSFDGEALDDLSLKFVPTEEELAEARAHGRAVGERAKSG